MEFPDKTAERGAPARANEAERELLRRIAEGDRDAFRDLYLRYHRRLARFLVRVTRGREDAEEIINDTLWIVWKQARQFRNDSRVSTWILGIAYRQGLKCIRRAAAHARMLSREQNSAVDEDYRPLDDSLDRASLEQALSQLPSEQRMVLEFAYYMELSCEEIGEIMNCPVNTVKTRMFHARRKLRVLLSTWDRSAGDLHGA